MVTGSLPVSGSSVICPSEEFLSMESIYFYFSGDRESNRHGGRSPGSATSEECKQFELRFTPVPAGLEAIVHSGCDCQREPRILAFHRFSGQFSAFNL